VPLPRERYEFSDPHVGQGDGYGRSDANLTRMISQDDEVEGSELRYEPSGTTLLSRSSELDLQDYGTYHSNTEVPSHHDYRPPSYLDHLSPPVRSRNSSPEVDYIRRSHDRRQPLTMPGLPRRSRRTGVRNSERLFSTPERNRSFSDRHRRSNDRHRHSNDRPRHSDDRHRRSDDRRRRSNARHRHSNDEPRRSTGNDSPRYHREHTILEGVVYNRALLANRRRQPAPNLSETDRIELWRLNIG
jgi:hypothetical protein